LKENKNRKQPTPPEITEEEGCKNLKPAVKTKPNPRGGQAWPIQPIQYKKLVSTNLAHY
jgi:hypothetical protein